MIINESQHRQITIEVDADKAAAVIEKMQADGYTITRVAKWRDDYPPDHDFMVLDRPRNETLLMSAIQRVRSDMLDLLHRLYENAYWDDQSIIYHLCNSIQRVSTYMNDTNKYFNFCRRYPDHPDHKKYWIPHALVQKQEDE